MMKRIEANGTKTETTIRDVVLDDLLVVVEPACERSSSVPPHKYSRLHLWIRSKLETAN